ncbi:MAG: hypothetical protein ACFB6S_01945 [Geminicoccaceae bacterium]
MLALNKHLGQCRLMRALAVGVFLLVILSAPRPVWSEKQSFELEGIVISAEHGGIRLLDAWGRGSRQDPFTVVEEIHDDGPAILTIRNLDTSFGNPRYVGHTVGFVLKKIVTNRTRQPWTLFVMELREALGKESGYYDGLSFGQANSRVGYVLSDRYVTIDINDEPIDAIHFQGATINPGETVQMQIAITDHSPQTTFYLLQRRPIRLANPALPQPPRSRQPPSRG